MNISFSLISLLVSEPLWQTPQTNRGRIYRCNTDNCQTIPLSGNRPVFTIIHTTFHLFTTGLNENEKELSGCFYPKYLTMILSILHPGSVNVNAMLYLLLESLSCHSFTFLSSLLLIPVPEFAVNMSLGLTMTWDSASRNTLVRGSLMKH